MGFNTFPCNPYPISTEELNKGNNDDLNTRVAALESDVSDLNSNKANQITIAPFFNAETAYTAGDLVYYNGLSYRCTNDHEGAWDADDFAATTISNELIALKSGLTNLQSGIAFGELPSNGFDPLTQCSGFFCFSVYPDNGILQGIPTDYSAYGTVFGCSGTRYQLLGYIDVTGKLAFWTPSSVWVAYSAV